MEKYMPNPAPAFAYEDMIFTVLSRRAARLLLRNTNRHYLYQSRTTIEFKYMFTLGLLDGYAVVGGFFPLWCWYICVKMEA